MVVDTIRERPPDTTPVELVATRSRAAVSRSSAARYSKRRAPEPPSDAAGSAIFEPTADAFLVSAWLQYARSVTIEVSDATG